MKSVLLGFAISFFAAGGHAINKENIRVVPTKTLVTMEIDGQFPAGPETDVLFVVDDSGSMTTHQNNLANHIDLFAEEAVKTSNSFHIGVINTAIKKDIFGNVKTEVGEIFGNPRIITPTTKNVVDALRANLKLGSNGSGTESVFLPVTEALSSENLNGMNAGFLRESAHLSVVVLTDAEDQSQISAWDFVDNLVDLKKGIDNVSMQAVMVSSVENENKTCQADGEPAFKIEEALRLLRGDQYSLCSQQMAQDVVSLAKNVFPPFPGEFKPGIAIDEVTLFGEPDVSSIKVQFGNQIIKEHSKFGWSYRKESNTLVFRPGIVWRPQAKDTPISITYRPL